MTGKQPYEIDEMLRRIRELVRPLAPAALFGLAEEGYGSVFEQVVACILSVRTKDEATFTTARRLFAQAMTPAAMARLSEEEIDRLIQPSTFHEAKARQIRTVAQLAEEQYEGALPCGEVALRALPGVGPKCANLVLGIACGADKISVDVHVWRVTNRWGYIDAGTPEAALAQLEAKLPRRHWTGLNQALMPFGKHHCTGVRPKCSTCPVLAYCRQVGVTDHR